MLVLSRLNSVSSSDFGLPWIVGFGTSVSFSFSMANMVFLIVFSEGEFCPKVRPSF